MVLMQGPRGGLFLMSEVPLYRTLRPASRVAGLYCLTQSALRVVLRKLIPATIRQLIPDISNSRG